MKVGRHGGQKPAASPLPGRNRRNVLAWTRAWSLDPELKWEVQAWRRGI